MHQELPIFTGQGITSLIGIFAFFSLSNMLFENIPVTLLS
jgi:hypothetical protein